MTTENKETNVVVLFRTFDELQQDQQRIIDDFCEGWGQAHRANAEEQARIEKMAAESAAEGNGYDLAKLDVTDLQLVKAAVFSELAAMKVRLDTVAASQRAIGDLADRLAVAVKKRNERLFGVGEIARRSARFASAQQRRPVSGGAATVTRLVPKNERPN